MKKAFTLIETLTVIVILGIIALIAVPTVNKIIEKSRNQAYAEQKNRIVVAAKKWGAENIFLLPPSSSEHKCLKVEELKKEGYLSKENIINPINGDVVNGFVKIIFEDKSNQYKYEYAEKCE